jgi:hypothetical protein
MRFFSLGLLALVLVLLAVVGCERSTTAPEPVASSGADKELNLPQDFLDWLWYSNRMTWQLFTGTVSVAGGGVLLAQPEGWGSPCVCRVEVPAGALSPTIAARVDPDRDGLYMIRIYIPVVPNPLPHPWVPVFKLEPEGIEFDPPALVTLYYPPQLPQADVLQVFRLVPGPIIGYDNDHTVGAIGDGIYEHSITFAAPHFSRWPLTEGKGAAPQL